MSVQVKLNVEARQNSMISPENKNEIISFQQNSSPTWNSSFTINVRPTGGYKLQECVLVMTQTAAITDLSGSVTNYPHMIPEPLWFSSVVVNCNGVEIDSKKGEEIFTLLQLYNDDETRLGINYAMSPYFSAASRSSLNAAGSKYYLPLPFDFITGAKFNVLDSRNELEFKFNQLPVTSAVAQSTLTGTPTVNFTAEILAKITRLPPALISNELSQIVKTPKHYLFHKSQYLASNLASGTTSASIPLTSITGNISHLFFHIKAASALYGSTATTYLPITNYSILSSDGSSLTGGRSILSREALLVNGKDWSKSSYLCDFAVGTSDSYVYLHSFSADPEEALASGRKLGSRPFSGNEILQITCSALGSASLLEIYAFRESALEISNNGVRVLSV